MQSHTPPSGSRTEEPTGTDFTVTLGKLHLNKRFARILDWRPTRTAPTLWTGDRLGFPVNEEVGEIITGLGLIPVGLERGTNQIHLMVRS
jgi:hypothetical protein